MKKKDSTTPLSAEAAAILTASINKSEELIEHKLKHVNNLMVGVIIVLFVGFLTMLLSLGALIWNAFSSSGASYNELVLQIREQRMFIDRMATNEQQNCNVQPTIPDKQLPAKK